MAYFDGCVLPVPTSDQDRFIEQARRIDAKFMERGARRVVECWGEDVTPGHTTDFQRAVDLKDGETVVFSWIEWPDKATRDSAMAELMADDAMTSEPMVVDGKRMIFGGFEPLVTGGDLAALPYVQGFIVPVPATGREEYRRVAQEAWDVLFQPFGAVCVLEAWGDDVPHGEATDFYRAVQATQEEAIVFSFMAWPSREACNAAAERMQNDPEVKMPEGPMPFDGKRMIYGGFVPVVKLGD